MRFVASSPTLLALCLVLSTSAGADDWPQWRGPGRDGISHEKGLLQSWDEGGPPVVWTAAGLGAGYSSVAVTGGRIYTMGRQRDGQHVIALDRKTGEKLWSTRVGGGGRPNCTPTVDGDLVFALGTGGDLVCVDATSGEEVWSKNFGRDFGGKMMSTWGYSESPLVDGERLICTPGAKDATIAALDKRTGETIWTAPIADFGDRGLDGAGYSSIVVAEVGGIRQYVQLVGRGVIGVSAKDGRFLWGYDGVANTTANIPTPIVKENYVFCSSGYNTGAALLRLTASGGEVSAEQVYFLEHRTLQNHHGGMILLDGYIYCGHGHNNGFPICIQMRTGEIAWFKGRGPGEGSAAVAYADGRLYFRYQNGLVALIDASPEGYQLRGTFQIPGDDRNSWPHPAIADGKLYLRAQDKLWCYDIKR